MGHIENMCEYVENFLTTGIDESELRYLSFYVVERKFGGPEEGGWWYTWYNHVRSITFANEELADKAEKELRQQLYEINRRELENKYKRMSQLPDRESPYLDNEGYIPQNWSDGGNTIIIVEKKPGGLAEDQEVPRYE